jgi:hypothetical protein
MEASSIDLYLIKNYGRKSVAELSAETGVAIADIASRTEDAIGSRDYLKERSRVAALLSRLEDAAAQLEDRLPEASDRNASAIGNAIGGLLGRSLGELRKIRAEDKLSEAQIEESYSKKFADMIDLAFQRRRGQLEAMFPQLSADEHEDAFRQTILEVAREADRE